MHKFQHQSPLLHPQIKFGGETSRGAKRPVGAKRPGANRPGAKRPGGETSRGGNGFGAKRPGTDWSTEVRSKNGSEKEVSCCFVGFVLLFHA